MIQFLGDYEFRIWKNFIYSIYKNILVKLTVNLNLLPF